MESYIPFISFKMNNYLPKLLATVILLLLPLLLLLLLLEQHKFISMFYPHFFTSAIFYNPYIYICYIRNIL